MKLISFDIGIKNLAYCIFEINSENTIKIQNWNVLNLMEITSPKKCSLCLKTGTFEINNKIYCKKHSKNEKFIFPSPKYKISKIKKMKKEELCLFCNEHNIKMDENTKKNEILDFIEKWIQNNVLKPIKTMKSSEIDLITIGRNMKIKLNEINEINEITHVIIENQISPIANRMKTIQGMLAQYFIMTSTARIEFVSSHNKLNCFQQTEEKNTYRKNKKDAITICKKILEENAEFSKWKHNMETLKKDDLADCFLQGYAYIENNFICGELKNNKSMK